MGICATQYFLLQRTKNESTRAPRSVRQLFVHASAGGFASEGPICGGRTVRPIEAPSLVKDDCYGRNYFRHHFEGKPKPVAIGATGSESPKFEMPRFEMPKFEIPTAFREFAEKGIAQAREN
jgi:hypothetical protein